jgi:hypothetical protein
MIRIATRMPTVSKKEGQHSVPLKILSRFRAVTVDGAWTVNRIYWPTCTHHTELQVITAPSLMSTIYSSLKHPLSLFQPDMPSPAVSWQRLLTVEILQLAALWSSCHSSPYRTLVNCQLFLTSLAVLNCAANPQQTRCHLFSIINSTIKPVMHVLKKSTVAKGC